MSVTLPTYVVLQSAYNHNYLQFVHKGDLHGCLQFSGRDVVSPYTQFEVQVSESDKTLVHLRSCYNNKYWVPSTKAGTWVLAAANDPEEDRTKLSCTLFQPVYTGDDSKSVRFMHVNSKKYVALTDVPGTLRDTCMYLASDSNGQLLHTVFSAIDWSSFVIFPRYVAVKGSVNGKYLSALPLDGVNYLQFVADDLADKTVGQEVFPSGAGNISIMSQTYKNFWTQTGKFVLAHTTGNDFANKNILFSPISTRSGENVFMLRNLGYNDYCRSIDIPTPIGDPKPVLGADHAITTLSHLEVVDRATSWSVTLEDADWHESDARDPRPTNVVLGASDEVVNDTDSAIDVTVTLSYVAVSTTYGWSSTMNGSLKVGVTPVTVTTPIPDELNIAPTVLTRSTTHKVIWGVEQKVSHDRTCTSYNVTIPARTKVTVQAVGRKTLRDVPFSYTQAITLSDGSIFSSKMDDGIYTASFTGFWIFWEIFAPIK